jgi:hypothetical protein
MTTLRLALLLLGLLGLGLPLASRALLPPAPSLAALPAAAPSTRTAHAVFSSTKGGVVTDVDLYATASPDGAEVVFEVSQYRPRCAHHGCPQVLFHAFNQAPLAAEALQIGAALGTATLRATVPVQEPLAAGTQTVELELTWTAVGRLARDGHEAGEGLRAATAAGSLRAGPTNFTPKPSIDAQLEEWS